MGTFSRLRALALLAACLVSLQHVCSAKRISLKINLGGSHTGDFVPEDGVMEFDPDMPKMRYHGEIKGAGDDLEVFKTQRFTRGQDLLLKVPVPDGVYSVTLMFAETWSGAFQRGVRLFDVYLGSKPAGVVKVIQALDMFGAAGGAAPIRKKFKGISTHDGLTVVLRPVKQNPQIAGIIIEGHSYQNTVLEDLPKVPGDPSVPAPDFSVVNRVAPQMHVDPSLLYDPNADPKFRKSEANAPPQFPLLGASAGTAFSQRSPSDSLFGPRNGPASNAQGLENSNRFGSTPTGRQSYGQQSLPGAGSGVASFGASATSFGSGASSFGSYGAAPQQYRFSGAPGLGFRRRILQVGSNMARGLEDRPVGPGQASLIAEAPANPVASLSSSPQSYRSGPDSYPYMHMPNGQYSNLEDNQVQHDAAKIGQAVTSDNSNMYDAADKSSQSLPSLNDSGELVPRDDVQVSRSQSPDYNARYAVNQRASDISLNTAGASEPHYRSGLDGQYTALVGGELHRNKGVGASISDAFPASRETVSRFGNAGIHLSEQLPPVDRSEAQQYTQDPSLRVESPRSGVAAPQFVGSVSSDTGVVARSAEQVSSALRESELPQNQGASSISGVSAPRPDLTYSRSVGAHGYESGQQEKDFGNINGRNINQIPQTRLSQLASIEQPSLPHNSGVRRRNDIAERQEMLPSAHMSSASQNEKSNQLGEQQAENRGNLVSDNQLAQRQPPYEPESNTQQGLSDRVLQQRPRLDSLPSRVSNEPAGQAEAYSHVGIASPGSELDGVCINNATHCSCGEADSQAVDECLYVISETSDPKLCRRDRCNAQYICGCARAASSFCERIVVNSILIETHLAEPILPGDPTVVPCNRQDTEYGMTVLEPISR